MQRKNLDWSSFPFKTLNLTVYYRFPSVVFVCLNVDREKIYAFVLQNLELYYPTQKLAPFCTLRYKFIEFSVN